MATGLEQEVASVVGGLDGLGEGETPVVAEITAQDYIDAYYQYKDDPNKIKLRQTFNQYPFMALKTAGEKKLRFAQALYLAIYQSKFLKNNSIAFGREDNPEIWLQAESLLVEHVSNIWLEVSTQHAILADPNDEYTVPFDTKFWPKKTTDTEKLIYELRNVLLPDRKLNSHQETGIRTTTEEILNRFSWLCYWGMLEGQLKRMNKTMHDGTGGDGFRATTPTPSILQKDEFGKRFRHPYN